MTDTAILLSLIATAQGAIGVVSDIALRLGVTIWAITFLFALATSIAGGATGIAAMVVGRIISGGLILGAIGFAPLIAQETFATADEVSRMITGSGVTSWDVVQRGSDLAARTWDAGISGSAFNPMNVLSYAWMLMIAAIIFALHLMLSLVVGISILQLWLGSAILTLALPFALVTGLSGAGLTALAFLIAAAIRLIILMTVIAGIGDAMFGLMVPGEGETLTWDAGINALGASIIVTFVAMMASTWSSVLTRGAVGNSGISGALTSAGLMATGARIGSASAGGARAGAARAGAASPGAAAAGSAPGGGAPGGGGGRGGGGGTGEVGVQERA